MPSMSVDIYICFLFSRVAEPPDFWRLRLRPLQKLKGSGSWWIVPKVEHVNSVILYQGRKYFFLVVRNLFIVFCLTIHQEPEPEPELEPEPTLSIFFGSGSSQKGRLRAAPAPTPAPAPQLWHTHTHTLLVNCWGGSVLAKANADLILTGEMSHHEVLDFVHR